MLGTLLKRERIKMSLLWTPSMFQKLFEVVAKSDKGVLGAMGGRQRSVSLSEFLAFMKANGYQTLGLTMSDLTDAFKFANNVTGCAVGALALQAEDGSDNGPMLRRGILKDKSEMSEEEFWQCLMFVQARYTALQSNPHVPVPTTRAAFEYNHRGVQQLGRFMQELCGKAIVLRLGYNQKEASLNLSKNEGTPREGQSAQPPSKSRRKKSPGQGKGGSRVEEDAPLTDVEKMRVYVSPCFGRSSASLGACLACDELLRRRMTNTFHMYGELRSLMVRAQKKRLQNDYIRNIISGVTSALPPKPNMREVHERSNLVDVYRTTTQGIADLSARCLDLDREIASTSSRIRALAEQRRNGVALLDGDNEGFWGERKDGQKMWISHAEQKRLELYERQLTARVTELTQRAGDTISHNMELRREIDEIRRNYMTLKAETADALHTSNFVFTALESGRATVSYMIDQHEQIGKFVTKEQQAAKELAAAAELRLKNLRLQTQKDCKDLEARLQQLDKEGLEMEQALMAAPPDFAMVREVRARALKLQRDLHETRSLVESKEALLLRLHSAMSLAPRYRFEKTESGLNLRVIDVGDIVERFRACEKSLLESEKLLEQRRDTITAQKEDLVSLQCIVAGEEQRVIQEEEKSRAVQAQQSIEIATAAAAVDAETSRCNRAERLLFSLESRLAELNDKFEQKTVEAAPPEAPVRSFVQEPPPQTATEAAARALEQRLSRLTGSSITLLAVDVPLSRGVVDLLAVDKRGRLFLIFFPAASEISTHHIEHIDDTRSSFYTIRSLPSALVAELTCCFTRHPPPNPPSMTQRSASDVLSSRVHRTIAVAREVDREQAKAGEKLGIEVYSDAALAEVWNGTGGALTKNLLMGGLMSAAEVIAAARSEALFFVPNSADDDDTQEAAVAAAAAAAAASSITASQFIDWLLGTAAAARGGSYSGGDTSTDRGSSPESTHGRARASRQGSADREQQQQRQQREDRRQVRQAMSLIKAAVIEVLEFEASRDSKEALDAGIILPPTDVPNIIMTEPLIARCFAALGQYYGGGGGSMYEACCRSFESLKSYRATKYKKPLLYAEALDAQGDGLDGSSGDAGAGAAPEQLETLPTVDDDILNAVARQVMKQLRLFKVQPPPTPPPLPRSPPPPVHAPMYSISYSEPPPQEFSLFGHLNIEGLLNLSRFESIVSAALIKHELKLGQKRDEHGRAAKWSAGGHRRAGARQGLVQVPRCDSPSSDEAEVARRSAFESFFLGSRSPSPGRVARGGSSSPVSSPSPVPLAASMTLARGGDTALVDTLALRKMVKALPITQGQDGIHRIIFPASFSPLSASPSSPHLSHKPRHSVRPQRVYTGANMASLKKLPRESIYPQLHQNMRSSLVKFEKITRDVGRSKGSQLLISLSRPYTAASTGGMASRSSLSHRESSSHLSDYEASSGPSAPSTPRAGDGGLAVKCPGLPADSDASAAAVDLESPSSDYRRMDSLTGGSGALSRPLTARVSIYAPAPALKKQYASPKNGTSASTSATSPKSPSAGACRTLTDDSAVAARAQTSAPPARCAATSHGEPSPRVRSFRAAATPEKVNDRPSSSPSAAAAKVKCEPLRSFTADPAFHAAAAAVAAAAERRKANPPSANAQRSHASNAGGGSGGGKLSERAKSSGDDAAPPAPPSHAPSSATQSVAAAKSL